MAKKIQVITATPTMKNLDGTTTIPGYEKPGAVLVQPKVDRDEAIVVNGPPAIVVPTAPVLPPVKTGPIPAPVKAKKPVTGEEFFETGEAAIAALAGREKGARQAFKLVAPDGTVSYMVSHNHHHAQGVMFRKLGGKCTRIDVKERETKVDVVGAVTALPAEEQAAVIAQLLKLMGK